MILDGGAEKLVLSLSKMNFTLQDCYLWNRLKDKWINKVEEEFQTFQAISLNYDNVIFPFSFLAIGMFVAVIVITGEFCKRTARGGLNTNGSNRGSVGSGEIKAAF